MTIMLGAIALFALMFLVGLIGPSVQTDTPGARSSDIAFTAAGEEGLGVYSSLGCAACHTQMVRPVVADVGLGGVTLNDANQPLGTRRFGPDLSDVGSRLSGSQMEAIITGFDGHPSTGLSSNDLNALVSYLVESNTSGGGS
jgi:cbb3-type cytochrome oxidase cytochrome c subunit